MSPAERAELRFPRAFGASTIIVVLIAAGLLWFTGQRIGVDRMAAMTTDAGLAAVGLKEDSRVLSGLARIADGMWPLQIAERTEVARIENFDPDRLPPFAHIESEAVAVEALNPETLEMETTTETRDVLVEPAGYLARILVKMLETLEMSAWSTLIAVIISAPLAVLAARNYTPHGALYFVARSVISLLRAIPEMFSALILVLAYGFGPIPGVIALALHSAGFLAKFYAEDIEAADPRPQEALIAIGAGKLNALRHAVLPQVAPQYVAYTLYVLDRNVRMATVIGIVGAGGIGQELKGRFDMYDYAHVGTILVVIFLTVLLLDQLSARIRGQLIAGADIRS
jgi:phosphonate transport system permease protein